MEYHNISCVAVVGMGYVGMPLAVEFSYHIEHVIGFDLNKSKIDLYNNGIDPTMEVGDSKIKDCSVEFTTDETKLHNAQVIIVAVPTPVHSDNSPDLTPLQSASQIVGRNMSRNTIVVYESTVYPGVTENYCVPILEEFSKMQCGVGFSVGYSPERINPGDTIHRLQTITKVVSGIDESCASVIQSLYNTIITAGTYRVSSIKTAEAIKVIENTQRDVNIAFINEIAMICHTLNIDTKEVINGMNTKWNALKFTPGLVGGHCIGVDPYYLIKLAEQNKCDFSLIQNSRNLNESVSKYIADSCVKMMVKAGQTPKRSKVVILGLTFKENCPDFRNSKVADIILSLKEYGICPFAADPYLTQESQAGEFGTTLCNLETLDDADCIIVAVSHNQYKEMSASEILKMYKADTNKVLIDVKGIYDKGIMESNGISVWQL